MRGLNPNPRVGLDHQRLGHLSASINKSHVDLPLDARWVDMGLELFQTPRESAANHRVRPRALACVAPSCSRLNFASVG